VPASLVAVGGSGQELKLVVVLAVLLRDVGAEHGDLGRRVGLETACSKRESVTGKKTKQFAARTFVFDFTIIWWLLLNSF